MRHVLDCIGLDGETTQVRREDLFPRVNRIAKLIEVLKTQVVGRDTLIDRILFALCTREHVLTWGPPGTGKSLIMRKIVRASRGMRSFSIGLSAETTESKLFGDPDGAHFRETGEIRHLVEGSILDAHLVRLGECLNGGSQLLESLNDVLEEREFHRGKQIVRAPLMTTLADTNVDPMEAVGANRDLEPFIDRFVFLMPVGYVEGTEQRLRMLRKYKSRAVHAPLPELTLEDLVTVSGVIIKSDLAEDTVIEQAYEELVRVFCDATGETIGDRTWLRMSQLIELSALLNGRTHATLDDLRLTGAGLIRRPGEEEAFENALAQVVDGKWKRAEHQERIQAEEEILARIEASLPSEDEIAERSVNAFPQLLRRLKAATSRLNQLTMSSQTNRDRLQMLLADIEVRQTMLFGVVQKATDPEDLAEADELIAAGTSPDDPTEPKSGEDPDEAS
ncbi:hypothetical protein COV05_01920 [Candidatus Uhrbacteria bacterium CG10_big_fil_rev_8_21_14_0_10_48_16]|uniref:MoxR domain-containing protein n=1 Tax=Candidatus Uhrbacteria bacterium CG10_big_fil_rev_8_21_14_0_10_48_16 TaxID=1975038 RepID=A0A2M8LHK5_9BACT|nr:MAG: hypothetical protein COV05_01920 [Candidatus Uhrbacteria bacterium CG10_big_fil_rev_8_21_14_0_10_48_16]